MDGPQRLSDPPTLGPDASICSICTYLIGVFVWVQFGVTAYHQCLSVSQSDSIESRNRSRVPSSPPQKKNTATEELLWSGQTSQHRLFCSLWSSDCVMGRRYEATTQRGTTGQEEISGDGDSRLNRPAGTCRTAPSSWFPEQNLQNRQSSRGVAPTPL